MNKGFIDIGEYFDSVKQLQEAYTQQRLLLQNLYKSSNNVRSMIAQEKIGCPGWSRTVKDWKESLKAVKDYANEQKNKSVQSS